MKLFIVHVYSSSNGWSRNTLRMIAFDLCECNFLFCLYFQINLINSLTCVQQLHHSSAAPNHLGPSTAASSSSSPSVSILFVKTKQTYHQDLRRLWMPQLNELCQVILDKYLLHLNCVVAHYQMYGVFNTNRKKLYKCWSCNQYYLNCGITNRVHDLIQPSISNVLTLEHLTKAQSRLNSY